MKKEDVVIRERLAVVENNSRTNHKRLKKIEQQLDDIIKCISRIAIAEGDIKDLEDNFQAINKIINDYKDKPNKLIDTLRTNIINYVIMALIGALFALIIK